MRREKDFLNLQSGRATQAGHVKIKHLSLPFRRTRRCQLSRAARSEGAERSGAERSCSSVEKRAGRMNILVRAMESISTRAQEITGVE